MKALTGTLPYGTSPTLCHEHSVAVADPVRPYPRDTGFFCRSFAAVVSVPLSQPHSFDAEMALPRRNRLPDAGAPKRKTRFSAKYGSALSACFGQGFLNDGRRIRCGAVQIPIHRTLVACETGEFKFASLGHYRNVHGSVKTGSGCYSALPDQFQQAQVA
jgi:hypothetical protein